jgi:hypothetical protein
MYLLFPDFGWRAVKSIDRHVGSQKVANRLTMTPAAKDTVSLVPP